MRPKSVLLLPPRDLSSCISIAIFRDTRGVTLNDAERFNYFPASPLISVTCMITGELRLVPEGGGLDAARTVTPLPGQTVLPPQSKPIVSWSPGLVAAVTIGFYPDAWARLGHALVGGPMPETLINAMNSFEQADDLETGWATFCKSFAPTWKIARAASEGPDWTGSDRIADWSRFLLGRAALSGSGRGIRTMERRLRRWTGQSRRSLNFFSAIEDLHRFSIKSPDVPLAELAVEAGYVDQSHMGRAIKRVTGFSPAQLNRLIETNESFWCYRLLGERF